MNRGQNTNTLFSLK